LHGDEKDGQTMNHPKRIGKPLTLNLDADCSTGKRRVSAEG
jgi:hypothetical protein